MKIKEQQLLKPLTTFDIGGSADYYCRVLTLDDLRRAMAFAKEKNIPYFILAGGSNILFADDGYRGLVIHMMMDSIVKDEQHVTIGAGAELMDLLVFAAQNGLSGGENLAGIPGSVGGAVRGNAGAFGSEIADLLVRVDVLDTHEDRIVTLARSDCRYGYRRSIFKELSRYIILSATFHFSTDKEYRIQDRMYDIVTLRNKKHIQNIKSAGSFFVNPVVPATVQEEFLRDKGKKSRNDRVPAGWLLERVGLFRKRIGDIQAGEMHANYFLNVGEGTADQALQLASLAKTRVRDTFGVQLKEEVQLVGF